MTNRREILQLASLTAMAPLASAIATEKAPEFHVIAKGLKVAEGPVAMPDGSVLLVEIARGTLSRVSSDGKVTVVAELGGSPNGAAIGPGGACYVCNSGGYTFDLDADGHQRRALLQPDNYKGGSIQRVDLKTGKFTTLYTEVNGNRLRGPNDLVFDSTGGFWFSDLGKSRARDRDNGGVYWAKADGSEIREVVYPLDLPNGMGLSPDGRTLYVALSGLRQLLAFNVTGPGTLEMSGGAPVRRVLASVGGVVGFDSLKVEENGNVVIGTPLGSGFTIVSPTGEVTRMPIPGLDADNLDFGGKDRRTVYSTTAFPGMLVSMRWPRPGLQLNYKPT